MEKDTPSRSEQEALVKPGSLQQVRIDAGAIPKARIEAMARPALAAVRAAFEDPAFAAEYEHWKAEREAKPRQK